MIQQSTIERHVGKRYGRYTVLSFSREERYVSPKDGRETYQYFYVCRCDCGTVKTVRISGLQSTNPHGTKSCGCYCKDRTREAHTGNTYRRLGYGENARRYLFEQYRSNAERRGISFSLTRTQFEELTSGPCFYCDAPPERECQPTNAHGSYRYNGIDRMDNSIGYVLENCCSCCNKCNTLKNGITKEMIRRLYLRLFTEERAALPLPALPQAGEDFTSGVTPPGKLGRGKGKIAAVNGAKQRTLEELWSA
jgi:hypothetical protein